jgi:YHS domain-containing protein
MLRWLLIAILIVFVIRALSRLMTGVLEGAGYRRDGGARSFGSAQGRPAVKLVRDPVCGMFVMPGKALTATASGETKYFCSDTCRRTWTASHR